MGYPRLAFCIIFMFVFPALLFATPDDDETAGPSGHAPAPPVTTWSERYLAGLESHIQAAASTFYLLLKVEAFQQQERQPMSSWCR
jgi:hypothetical protein